MDEALKILGAIERKLDPRDLLLGSVAAPAEIPSFYLPDNSWLIRNFQGQTPYCGAHALSHFKAIMDHNENPAVNQRLTPRFIWNKVKQIDGAPLEAGTDMRSLFKVLQNIGADDFEPLENDVTLPIAEYSSPSVITPAMLANASGKKISNYAFDALDFASLQQLIYKYKAVLLLIKCDGQFWGTTTPTFTNTPYTHFVCADGYSETEIRVIDSADPNNAYAVKMINKQYVTPKFIKESGTAIDPETAQAIKSQIVSTAAEVVTVAQQLPPAEEKSVLQQIFELLTNLFPQKGRGISTQSNMTKIQQAFVSLGIRLGVIAAIAILDYLIKNITNIGLPDALLTVPVLGMILSEADTWLVNWEGTNPPNASTTVAN